MVNARQAWRNAIRDSGLDQTAKAVAWTLDTYLDSHGDGWPSRRLLAEGAGCGNLHTVSCAIRRLEQAGLVRVTRSKGRWANRYHATAPNGSSGEPVNGSVDAPVTGRLAASNGYRTAPRTRSTEQVIEQGRRSREEPRPVADAYRPFNHGRHKVDVDPAMLELARHWLRP